MRPIDADALMSLYENAGTLNIDAYKVPVPVVRQNIMATPTLDYAPVRRGKWIRANEEQVYFDVEYMCSECQFVVAVSGIGTPLLYGYKHCPNCGAKMDAKEDKKDD